MITQLLASRPYNAASIDMIYGNIADLILRFSSTTPGSTMLVY